jgi:hypothetical protein
VTKTVKHHNSKQQKCATKLVNGPVTFTTAGTARAALSRHGRVAAVGTARGRRLVLHTRRALTPTRYTLTLTANHTTTRQTITVS